MSEFVNVCRKKLIGRVSPLTPADVEAAFQDFRALNMLWLSIDPLTDNAWRLYRNHGIETGDTYFLEAARVWDAELWTIDPIFYVRANRIHGKVYDLRALPFR